MDVTLPIETVNDLSDYAKEIGQLNDPVLSL